MPASVFEKTTRVEDAFREASKIKSAVTDAVKNNLRTANQQIRKGRYAAEDLIEEAKHAVKQKPIAVVAIAFITGLVVGGILTCAIAPRRL
jgi:ElaB/YqjD/DUF883 family membrane-anchored ribosome-binding protein